MLLYNYQPNYEEIMGAIKRSFEQGKYEILQLLIAFKSNFEQMSPDGKLLSHVTRMYYAGKERRMFTYQERIKKLLLMILEGGTPECDCNECAEISKVANLPTTKLKEEIKDNGKSENQPDSKGEHPQNANGEIAESKQAENEGSNINDLKPNPSKKTRGYRLLCLDGGGIKGLVLIGALIYIQKRLKKLGSQKDLAELFDYVVGTSTGAIIAVAVAESTTINSN